jgi:hypothetical protein
MCHARGGKTAARTLTWPPQPKGLQHTRCRQLSIPMNTLSPALRCAYTLATQLSYLHVKVVQHQAPAPRFRWASNGPLLATHTLRLQQAAAAAAHAAACKRSWYVIIQHICVWQQVCS